MTLTVKANGKVVILRNPFSIRIHWVSLWGTGYALTRSLEYFSLQMGDSTVHLETPNKSTFLGETDRPNPLIPPDEAPWTDCPY